MHREKNMDCYFCICLILSGCAGTETQKESAPASESAVSVSGADASYADKLFDRSYVHQIDVSLEDGSISARSRIGKDGENAGN